MTASSSTIRSTTSCIVAEKKLELYTGGYDEFEKRRAEASGSRPRAKSKQDAERAHLQAFVDRFKAKASKAAQAQSRMKRLAKMEPVHMTIEARVAPFTLPSPRRPLAPPLMQLEGVDVGYGDGVPVLRDLNLRLDVDDRIGLLGVNGAGKSTFAKLAAGALAAAGRAACSATGASRSAGSTSTRSRRSTRTTRRWTSSGARCRIARRRSGAPSSPSSASTSTSRRRSSTRCRAASARACSSTRSRWPRPTSSSSTSRRTISTSIRRRALLDALNDYEGAVILITHDRSLMELVADRLWLAADGHVKPFDGDMDDYARFVLDRARNGQRAPAQDRGDGARENRRSAKRRARG